VTGTVVLLCAHELVAEALVVAPAQETAALAVTAGSGRAGGAGGGGGGGPAGASPPAPERPKYYLKPRRVVTPIFIRFHSDLGDDADRRRYL
jgi:hypothetical protein